MALAIGVCRLLASARPARWLNFDGLFDMGAVVVLASVVVGSPIAVLVADDTVSPFVRAVWASYPVLDIALVALVVPAIFSRRLRSWAGVLLAGGLVLWLVADFAYMMAPESVLLLPWMDGGWMIGPVLIAGAVWYRGHGSQAQDDRALEDVGPVRLLVGLTPLLVPSAIDTVAHLQGRENNAIPLFAATALLTALAYGRAVRLTKASARSKRDLSSRERYFAKLAANFVGCGGRPRRAVANPQRSASRRPPRPAGNRDRRPRTDGLRRSPRS